MYYFNSLHRFRADEFNNVCDMLIDGKSLDDVYNVLIINAGVDDVTRYAFGVWFEAWLTIYPARRVELARCGKRFLKEKKLSKEQREQALVAAEVGCSIPDIARDLGTRPSAIDGYINSQKGRGLNKVHRVQVERWMRELIRELILLGFTNMQVSNLFWCETGVYLRYRTINYTRHGMGF